MTSIASLFTSDVLVKILTLLLLNPEQAFYQTEIYQKVGGTLGNTQKMLLKLQKTGLILHTKRGNMSYYQANKQHPVFEEMKRLLLKTVAVGDLLRENLEPLSHKIQLAFIFGSYARGEESVDSDIDVFILGKLSLREISEGLGDLPALLGREVNPVVHSGSEFRKKYQDHNRFVQELVSCPKIWLLGTEDELKAVVN